MNICFLTAEVPNPISGGIENVTLHLTRALQSRGHRVFWISLDATASGFGQDADGHISIGRHGDIPPNSIDFISTNNINIIINQAIDERLHQLVSVLRKSDIANLKFVKVFHTDPLYLIKGIRDKEPLYCEKSAIWRYIYKLLPTTQIRRYRRKAYSKSLYLRWLNLYNRIILLSESNIPDFYSITGSNDNGQITAIGNPITTRIQSGIDTKEKIVLFVGRMHREAKRPDRLLKIWRKIGLIHPDWKLIFIGDGPMRPCLEKYSKLHKFSDNVQFVGQTNPQDYYKKASILCMTSTYEGFPLVCIEALSNGVIPMAFDSFKAVRDLIRDGETGLLVKPIVSVSMPADSNH